MSEEKKWTRFMDMHSGGGRKEGPYEYIYIEAPEEEAKSIFYARFGHNPERVTCTCCGDDYSISEEETLERATAFERGCAWSDAARDYVEQPDAAKGYRQYVTLADYLAREDVLVVRAEDIKPEERSARVPRQGYVWCE